MNKGDLGRAIAKKLWPSITLVDGGSPIDKMGVDAYDGEYALQIKYDATIAKTNNLYHEIYEKSVNRPDQAWRNSPHKCDGYIFCTSTFALRVSVDTLAVAQKGRILQQISSTSMGFLIPIDDLSAKKISIRCL